MRHASAVASSRKQQGSVLRLAILALCAMLFGVTIRSSLQLKTSQLANQPAPPISSSRAPRANPTQPSPLSTPTPGEDDAREVGEHVPQKGGDDEQQSTNPSSPIQPKPSIATSNNRLAAHGDDDLPIIAPDEPDTFLPSQDVAEVDTSLRQKLLKGTSVSCVSKGMQEKCYFENLIVQRNQFKVFKGAAGSIGRYPSPIYPADGQNGPLKQYHKYKGHPIQQISGSGTDELPCTHVVTRPIIFLFRMSGHSTYHLWENNLGPFYATLQDNFNGKADVKRFNSQEELIVSFVDYKPRSGPKAPHLLDQLLRTFSQLPLINASQIVQPTCFTNAIVGVATNSFPHRQLLYTMMKNIVGRAPPPPLPRLPKAIYVSRNHKNVIRGRKITNEPEMITALNETLMKEIGVPIVKVHFEDLSYKEQVELAMNTNIMFSPHGGGVANCIWMQKGSIMVEFVAPVGKTLPNMYHSMCGKSGVSHFHFLADPDPEDEKMTDAQMNNNRRLFSNMVMPVEKIVENAKKAVGLYRKNYEKSLAKG